MLLSFHQRGYTKDGAMDQMFLPIPHPQPHPQIHMLHPKAHVIVLDTGPLGSKLVHKGGTPMVILMSS